jgi:hypothetical protein
MQRVEACLKISKSGPGINKKSGDIKRIDKIGGKYDQDYNQQF